MMKKIIFSIASACLLISCGNFDDINLNPDKPTTVTPDFLATNIILNTTKSDAGKWLFGDSWIMKSSGSTEHMEWYMYNKFERGNFDEYANLIDAKKMVAIAEANSSLPEGEKNAFKALSHFMRGYVFYKTTMSMGDIPCSEALLSEEGLVAPVYDTQEDVFNTILEDLQKASDLFGNSTKLNGDVVFGGNVTLWKNVTNSLMLRVLNMLSKKDQVGSINVRSTFEKVAASSLIRNESESFQRVYDSSKSSQWYPFYYEKQNYWSYPVMYSYFVDMLKELGDYRLFYYAEPATALVAFSEDSFDAYSGVNPLLEFGELQKEYTQGKHSTVNRRYHRLAQGEPIKFISYSETQFILAEAALRGWKTPNTAKEHYENGVRAAMQFTAAHTPNEYRHKVVIDESYVENYLKGKAAFNTERGLEQIMIQKYIGSFVQLAFNSYYDYRRTGFPQIPIDPKTNMNEIKTQIPLRWMYPSDEYSQNRENIEAAIQRQFGGSDTPNDVMWLLK
ncbi:MAG: SusD/RagB family nutrient-binding outer membrane lipoprotein [Bacteroidota bacterium]|uniref:SusD/RagB family nutrient-binding outer membrane lipoprotein n=1 Tax=Macellibacteroides fermentans TaxID=879969 RepID=UPI002891362E|nr:SusD/RagB family nutrient-binding outer membrane lipoprotein [Bacteroidota bacterium]MEA4808422.1 SusD/RagB family nutrient-binding outer membrane lipoprotein [Macellibacteroides fermentans]HML71247.1 SusD/RagB family nutrient-binding outer membrane lipoprotein [Macellibacteroides fermentans]